MSTCQEIKPYWYEFSKFILFHIPITQVELKDIQVQIGREDGGTATNGESAAISGVAICSENAETEEGKSASENKEKAKTVDDLKQEIEMVTFACEYMVSKNRTLPGDSYWVVPVANLCMVLIRFLWISRHIILSNSSSRTLRCHESAYCMLDCIAGSE